VFYGINDVAVIFKGKLC